MPHPWELFFIAMSVVGAIAPNAFPIEEVFYCDECGIGLYPNASPMRETFDCNKCGHSLFPNASPVGEVIDFDEGGCGLSPNASHAGEVYDCDEGGCSLPHGRGFCLRQVWLWRVNFSRTLYVVG